MRHLFFYSFLLLTLCLITNSCNPLAVQGPEPAFIDIPSVEFTYTIDKGPLTQKIDHVEIFFENNSIGYYTIPAKIAVVPTKENSNLTIMPAIRENGGLNAVTVYKMMTWHIEDRLFKPYETYTIIPKFDYNESTIFDLVETFESSNSFTFDLDNIDSTGLVRSNLTSRDGTYSGLIESKAGEKISVATDFLFANLSNNGRPVFLEFDYKCDVNFDMGMVVEGIGNSANVYFRTIAEKSEWNKIYIDLTELVLAIPAQGYRIYFEVDPAGTSTSQVFIDNLKLLHTK